MGDDFTNHQAFTADNPERQRTQLISALQGYMGENGFIEVIKLQEQDRRIAIGPVGRWTCIYDSFGNGDNQNPTEFKNLTLFLSRIVPVIDIHMDDSAAVHLLLYRDGMIADRFADRAGVVDIWASATDREIHQGKPELWAGLLSKPQQTEQVRKAWQLGSSDALLSRTAALMGWHPLLCTVGYTIDYDGVPVYYKDHLHGSQVDTSEFVEYYYRLNV